MRWTRSSGRRVGLASTVCTATVLLLPFAGLAPARVVGLTSRQRPKITEVKLPDSAQPSGQLAAGPGGNLWFSEANSSAGDILGEVTNGGTVKQVLRNSESDDSGYAVAVQPDGSVWFDDFTMGTNRLERRSPTGVITYLSFPDAFTTYVTVRQLIAGSGGTIWFTSDLGLGEVSPSGAFTRFALPHKLTPLGITRAPDGDMWFTSTVASEAVFVHDYIGRITPGGDMKLFRIPTLGSEPKSITVGRDGNLWFAERGAIERLTPRGRFTRFPIGIPDAQPQGIAAGRHGLWFSDPGTNSIGLMSLAGKAVEYRAPIQDGGVTGIVVKQNGDVWFEDIGDVGGRIGHLVLRG